MTWLPDIRRHDHIFTTKCSHQNIKFRISRTGPYEPINQLFTKYMNGLGLLVKRSPSILACVGQEKGKKI